MPGVVIGRRMARPTCAAPFNPSPRSAKSAAPPPSWRGARIRWSGTLSTPPIPALAHFADDVATGRILGGTGLSNPMKSFFGIEKLKLKGRKVEGGYSRARRAALGIQSRPDHFFGTIFEPDDRPGEIVMFRRRLLRSRDHTAAVQAVPGDGRHRHLRRAVPRCLRARCADPGASRPRPIIKKIRAGFILLQAGMGIGLIKRLHRDHERGRRAARSRQPLPAAAADQFPRIAWPISKPKPWRWRAIPSTPRTAIGVGCWRCGFGSATPASRPRMPRCFIAARAAT